MRFPSPTIVESKEGEMYALLPTNEEAVSVTKD